MIRRLLHILPVTILILAGVHSTDSAAQSAEAYVSMDSVTVGDRFDLTVSVGHDGSRTPLFPHELAADSLHSGTAILLQDFEILEVNHRGQRPYANGGVIDSVVYETTTFALDTARVAQVPVGLTSGADTLMTAAQGLFLPVTSLVPEDATEIRDIMPIAEFPRLWWPWILGLLALAAVVGALWWHRRRSGEDQHPGEPAQPQIPPYEQAMQRLRDLERRDIQLEENVKLFYVELADVLRTYLGRRVRVRALESTTRELARELERQQAAGRVPDGIIREVRDILSQADLVKFADVRPVQEETRQVVSMTKSTIETTEEALRAEELRRRAAMSAGHAESHAEHDDTDYTP